MNTTETMKFSTLKTDFLPGNVTNISAASYNNSVFNDGKHLDMFIKWSPAEGKIFFN